jgi:hypothetical protein
MCLMARSAAAGEHRTGEDIAERTLVGCKTDAMRRKEAARQAGAARPGWMAKDGAHDRVVRTFNATAAPLALRVLPLAALARRQIRFVDKRPLTPGHVLRNKLRNSVKKLFWLNVINFLISIKTGIHHTSNRKLFCNRWWG